MKRLIPILLFSSIISCSLFNNEADDEIDEAQLLWNEQNLSEYQFEYNYGCFCPQVEGAIVIVKGDTLHSVLDPLTFDSLLVQVSVEPDSSVYIMDLYPDLFGTIDDLFEVIRDAKQRNADKITQKYDSQLGYPTQIFIDYDFQTADDEFSYRVANVISSRLSTQN